MSTLRRRGRAFLLASAVTAGAATSAFANSALQPYQMVRSLQVIQDRLADGDHAALPMQRKILEMIDERLRTATPDDFADRRNFRALLIYGMSGGNPATLRAAMARLGPDENDRRLAGAIVDYLQGNSARALQTLQALDGIQQPEEIAAFLSLIKGSVIIAEKPGEGFAFFDRARLLAPGTLVEEAALRRTIGLAVQQKNADRFLRASEQYARRFLRSPYASNFADSFVAGVLELRDTIDLVQTAQIIAEMNAEQARVVYLRIARRAAIERYEGLVEFSRRGMGEPVAAADDAPPPDPRAVLYESLSAITSDKVDTVKQQLEGLDRNQLSANDRKLLDAALSLVTKVTSAPQQAAAASVQEPANRPDQVETIVERRPEPAPVETIVERREAPAAAVENNIPDPFVTSARQRLQEVDDLLKGARQ